MDTKSFLARVLPHAGGYVVAELRPRSDGKGTHWNYTQFDHVATAADAIAQHDEAGNTVYFACNSFGTWYEEPDKCTGKIKRHLRTQKNVIACRSLYDDIDTGKPGCYETKAEAGEAIKAFSHALGLVPLMVSSGGGFHLYWPLTEDVSPDEWLRLANLKRAVTTHFGLKADRAVDLDSARVLRPVGTHNRKNGNAREVRAINDAGPYTMEQVEGALLGYINRHNLTVIPPTPKIAEPSGMDDLSGGVEYPPSSAYEIIKHCATLAHVATNRGNVSEPLWRGMLGVVKHCVEGEALAHEWSAGHPEYDPGETQAKLENWMAGPTLCQTFEENSAHCADCPHRGKVKSPISLGYTIQTAAPQVEVETDNGSTAVFTPPHWPQGYHWDGQRLSKAVRNDDGGLDYIPFANALFYPVTRVREIDGSWGLQLRAFPGTRSDRTFVIPTKTVAEAQGLGTALATYEVFTIGKNGRLHAMSFIQDYIQEQRIAGVEAVTYPHFGWADDNEAFVLGSVKITKKGEAEVIPSKNIGPELGSMHECEGDTDSWVELVDLVYNRPGAELYQLIFCAAFASPLVELTAAQAWHGIPIALTGESGLGKTSTLAVACSLYGHHDRFIVNGGQAGTTLNAAVARFGAMRNLPVILDEITGRDDMEMRDLLYALSNGRIKDRLSSDGSPHPQNGLRWNMLSFISGNNEMSEMLSKLSANQATATEMRVLDLKIPEGFNARVWPTLNVKEIIEQKLKHQYGHAGRKWLRFLIKNRDAVKALLDKEMAKWAPKTMAETQERFYMNTLIHCIVAGHLARKLGLVRFDIDRLQQWGIEYIKSLRTGREAAEVTPEDLIAKFVSSLHGRMLITKYFRDGRCSDPEVPLDPLPRGPVAARLALSDRRFVVSAPAFSEWCRKENIAPRWLLNESAHLGYIRRKAGSDMQTRESLCKGTNVPSVRAKCIEFDYALIMGLTGDVADNVVQLPVKGHSENNGAEEMEQ